MGIWQAWEVRDFFKGMAPKASGKEDHERNVNLQHQVPPGSSDIQVHAGPDSLNPTGNSFLPRRWEPLLSVLEPTAAHGCLDESELPAWTLLLTSWAKSGEELQGLLLCSSWGRLVTTQSFKCSCQGTGSRSWQHRDIELSWVSRELTHPVLFLQFKKK